MPCTGLSRGPVTWSTRDFRAPSPWEAFRGPEDALVLALKDAAPSISPYYPE